MLLKPTRYLSISDGSSFKSHCKLLDLHTNQALVEMFVLYYIQRDRNNLTLLTASVFKHFNLINNTRTILHFREKTISFSCYVMKNIFGCQKVFQFFFLLFHFYLFCSLAIFPLKFSVLCLLNFFTLNLLSLNKFDTIQCNIELEKKHNAPIFHSIMLFPYNIFSIVFFSFSHSQ